MHHGQSRGEKNTRKVCKKQVNLPKTGGKICKSRGERIIFAKQGGKCTETAKIGGKIKKLWSMKKKARTGRPWMLSIGFGGNCRLNSKLKGTPDRQHLYPGLEYVAKNKCALSPSICKSQLH